jgi:hypothetical protein
MYSEHTLREQAFIADAYLSFNLKSEMSHYFFIRKVKDS